MDPWLIARADYYEDLTISSSASIRVIQAAYRVMAQDHHPDSGSNPDAERMMRINIAYDVLSDPRQKQRYDQLYRMHQQRSGEVAAPSPQTAPSRPRDAPASSAPFSRPSDLDPARGAWTDVWSFGVLLIGIFSVLVAVMIMLLT
jgi:curved DNA-binding protein CbpA